MNWLAMPPQCGVVADWARQCGSTVVSCATRPACLAYLSMSSTDSAMACPSSGGKALPICFAIWVREPENRKSSSNDCSLAPSRSVRARSWNGWMHLLEAG